MPSNISSFLNLTSYFIKSKLRLIIIYCLIILAMNLLVIIPYGSTTNLDISSLVNSLPQAYKAFFGDLALMNTSTGYLASKNFSLVYPMLQGILGISLGASLFGKNRTSGFFKFLLSRPISRVRLFSSLTASYITTMFIINAFNFLSLVIIAKFSGFSLNYLHTYLAFLALNLISFSFAALTALVATFARQEAALGAGYFVFFQSYLFSSLAVLFPNVSNIKYLSLFYYYNYTSNLFGSPSAGYFVILSLVFSILVSIGALTFKNKDL